MTFNLGCYARKLRSHICVGMFQVSDATGSMKVTVVKEENPFLQTDLISEECFILDHGQNKMIFVWKGNQKAAPDRSRIYFHLLCRVAGYVGLPCQHHSGLVCDHQGTKPIPASERRPWKQPRASSNRWATQQTHRFTYTLTPVIKTTRNDFIKVFYRALDDRFISNGHADPSAARRRRDPHV